MFDRFLVSDWRRQDSALAFVLLLFGGLVIREADKLPPPFFDPLGSAAVPRLVAGLLMGLAFILLIRCLRKPPQEHEGSADEPVATSPLVALMSAVLPALYVAAMQFGWLGFAPASALFILLMGGVLARWRPRALGVIAIVALLCGYGLNVILTDILYIDLPQESFWQEAD